MWPTWRRGRQGCLESTPRLSPGRLLRRYSCLPPLPYIGLQWGKSDPQRLSMSCAAIGCFVLSGELCGCWKAALKAREHLRLQRPWAAPRKAHCFRSAPVGVPLTSWQLWRVDFRLVTGGDEHFQGARREQIKTALEGEWKDTNQLTGGKKFNFLKAKQNTYLTVGEAPWDSCIIFRDSWGEIHLCIFWCLAKGLEFNFN